MQNHLKFPLLIILVCFGLIVLPKTVFADVAWPDEWRKERETNGPELFQNYNYNNITIGIAIFGVTTVSFGLLAILRRKLLK